MVDEIARLDVDPVHARVYEHGWQSWSPSTTYPADATSWRASGDLSARQHYRIGRPQPPHGFQGEGLLVVDDGAGTTTCFAAESPDRIPSVTARLDGGTLVVASGEPVAVTTAPDIATALTDFGDRFAAAAGAGPFRTPPTVWCSWYHYFTRVTEADVVENLDALDEAGLPVEVVQIDDGWQSKVGDWLTVSDRFESLRGIASRIAATGRRAGIWLAPFLTLPDSALARRHPDWLLPGAAGHNWGAETRGVDPYAASGYLTDVFTMLREAGFDYFKLDFLYAGAIGGIGAYRDGMAHIRRVVGDDAYLLACGAPVLPSVGLCDAMRIGPDIATRYAPRDGDPSTPSQQGAVMNTLGRAWQHGRFWVNDSDCVVARPAVERREEWADVVERFGGLRSASDRIADLDDWGLETTRRLLTHVPAPTPFPSA
ncbi:alpha-galactosidase [Stackebrandtia albiflava]|uniref:Alpha-galactosidase n=1 Tax=Stackebrandtia albiflava TaxID=406432 RepID=A0A562VA27_9ACTN|nr:glycoside hydrolase family 36 protein [Stackebrandtia albiflava]TWJ14691.1 alpha-galactosidase [Stackebrandtia albiflava]